MILRLFSILQNARRVFAGSRIGITILSALIFPQLSDARSPGFEYHAGGGARSVPLGAAASFGGGYDLLLWGDASNESVSYGFARPSLEWTLAPRLYAFAGKLTIYPISFIGLSVGRLSTFRYAETSLNVDCAQLECAGRLRADFFTTDLTLGANGYFYHTQLDWRDERPERDRFDFYEDSYVLPGRRGGDRAFTHGHTLGRKLGASRLGLHGLIAGVHVKRTEMILSGAASERFGIVAAGSRGDLRLNAFAGLYQSTWRGLQPTFGLSLVWSPKPGLSL